MTHIHDLPKEVLFNIFRIGCEELDLGNPDLEWNPPKPRRYPVIHTARAVCRKWQQFVGYHDHNSYNRGRFWYTASELSIGEDEPISDSAKRLPKFKRSLDASQHSDIWLRFDLPRSRDVVECPRDDAALLGLAVQYVDFIIPHQEQIVHYEIKADQPRFLSHLLGLLTYRMRRMYRRPTINFKRRLPPLSEILSAIPMIPSSLFISPVTAMSPSAHPAHLKHFDLTEHHLSWSDCALMKFPFTITNLVIPPVNLLRASSFFDAIGIGLVSLTICVKIDQHYKLDDEEFAPPKKCITLPRLLCLSIWCVSDSWAEYFLKHMVFPWLESVVLGPLSESSPSSKSNLELSLEPFGQSSDYPNLQSLCVVSVPASQHSIFCITRFMQRAIRNLAFKLSDSWEEFILVHPFELIQPERLKIHLTYWKMNLAILSSLNLSLLQELEMMASELYYEESSESDDHNSFLVRLGSFPAKLSSPLIESPLLRSISFWGLIPRDLLSLVNILGCINTRSPITLKVNFYVCDGIDSGVLDLRAHEYRFPSFITLEITLRYEVLNDYHFLVDLLSFTPGVQQLILIIPRADNVVADVMKLFTALATHDSQHMLLPCLSSFKANIQVNTRDLKNIHEQIKAIIFDCLVQRRHHGAVSLVLCDLYLDQNQELKIVLEQTPKKQSQRFSSHWN